MSLTGALVMRLQTVIRAVTAVLAITCSALTAGAATFIVDRTDDTATATACAAAANDCSLRGAIVAANALSEPSTINVPAGQSECLVSAVRAALSGCP
jgi:hypothetical protein